MSEMTQVPRSASPIAQVSASVETTSHLEVTSVPIFIPGDLTDSDGSSTQSADGRGSVGEAISCVVANSDGTDDSAVESESRGRSRTRAVSMEVEVKSDDGDIFFDSNPGGTTLSGDGGYIDENEFGKGTSSSDRIYHLQNYGDGETLGAAGKYLTEIPGEQRNGDNESNLSDASDIDDNASLFDLASDDGEALDSDLTDLDDTPRPRLQPAIDYHNADSIWWNSMMKRTWVTDDLWSIFDKDVKTMVRMPQNKTVKKKAIIELYLFLAKQVFFVKLSGGGDWSSRVIPGVLWYEVFTLKESLELQNATLKKIHHDLTARAITITEEWRLKYKFPKVPENLKEIKHAVKGAQIAVRLQMKRDFLDKESDANVDRWIKFLFQNVMDPERFDQILYHSRPVRCRVVEKMIIVTDFPFKDRISWPVTKQILEPAIWEQNFKDVVDKHLSIMLQNLNIKDS